MNTWILLAVNEVARTHGGNEGYADNVDSTYAWDSTVAHHAEIAVGDRVAIRDEAGLLGISVIDDISRSSGPKLRRRCPQCRKTAIRRRRKKLPEWYCTKCESEFDNPIAELLDVEIYRSEHGAGWIDLADLGVSKTQLQTAQKSPQTQQSLRHANWDDLVAILRQGGADEATRRFVDALTTSSGGSEPEGFTHVLARVRRGQKGFRDSMLGLYKNTCAVTGRQPEAVLEAAHLYSYAAVGKHHDHGGVLLRRDLHTLFDHGLLAIDPASQRVSVSGSLKPYEDYNCLTGRALAITLPTESLPWIRAHWNLHRSNGTSDAT